MARSSGLEPFSTFAHLPLSIALPADFPAHCSLRADSAAALPPPAMIDALAKGFADPAWKEAVISGHGLRLVVLAEEADRGSYLIYRESGLGRRPVPAAMARGLMDRLIALSETLHG